MNFLSLSDLSTEEVLYLLTRAKEIKDKGAFESGYGKFIANLFYEPSTRTRLSFEVAERKLGFDVINLDSKTSSIQKGETFYDTLKTIESIGVSGVVVRHTDTDCFEGLEGLNIPVINAGNGDANHPTQALTDLMTIAEEFEAKLEGLVVSIVGDIKHSRVARANIESLERFGMQVNLVTPHSLEENDLEYISMKEAIEISDVIMLLRNQYERHNEENTSKGLNQNSLQLTPDLVDQMKEGAIIMHPAPFNRGVEIHNDVVECDKSRIFKQMENGTFVRMAVLEWVFKKGEKK